MSNAQSQAIATSISLWIAREGIDWPQAAVRLGLKKKRLSDILHGFKEPTEAEVRQILEHIAAEPAAK